MTTVPKQISPAIPWLPLVACPDCAGAVEAVADGDAVAQCASCRRRFPKAANGLNLLPIGIAARGNDAAPTGRGWRQRFVARIYTRHNRAANVRRALAKVLDTLGGNDWGLNLGSADTRLHPRLLAMDIAVSAHVDVVGTADRLPFGDGALACVVSQEVFEHLADPVRAAREVLRVLRPGGLFYLQVPFVIGFHSGPHDYWRFTHKGIEQLLRSSGFEVLEVAAAVGAGTSMYRISVEFFAALAAALWSKLYFPTKATAAILCAPFRWADWLVTEPGDTNRIAAGFLAVARKPQ